VINEKDGALFRQIAADLRREITTRRLPPGQPVPSERTLGQRYGVARETVRRAHQLLRAEGLIERSRGRSLIVREQRALRDLEPAAGSTVIARMPTPRERDRHDLLDGVPVLEVTDPAGKVTVFPADRWRLHWPLA
jgi:DNA-binding transcriptional regulator YhcF (GntR family)